MTIQVSPVMETQGLSVASQRDAYWRRLLALGQSHPAPLSRLEPLRQQAATCFHATQFPTTRDEEWRFTDLSELLALDLAPSGNPSGVSLPTAAELAFYELPEAACARLVFVNGQFAPTLSAVAEMPPGVYVGSLAAAPEAIYTHLGQLPGRDEGFTALNTAGFSDAAVIYLPKNQVLDAPIQVLFVTTGEASALVQPRCVVVAEANSALTLVEDYSALGRTAHLVNAVTEIWLGENAQVNHTRIQAEADTTFHVGKTAIAQARTSRYIGHSIHCGGHLSRHHWEIYQTGEQTETVLNGLTYLRGHQTGDTHSAIALTQPHGQTRQLHKTIVDDRAHAIFNGKVFVPRAAQMTDAGQLNRNLLLSSKARIDTKPQLEIVADNVKCTHGAAIGQLEADEIFYLQSRGIDAASARQLLIYAFAYEILREIPVPSLQQRLLMQLNIAR